MAVVVRKNLFFLLLLLSMLSACGPTFSVPTGSLEDLSRGPEAFQSAKALVNNRCGTCHANFANYSEMDWERNGYIVPGAPQESLLYTKLRGVTPAGNMPSSGNPLSDAEKNILFAWIEGVGQNEQPNETTAAGRRTKAFAVIQRSCASCHGVSVVAISTSYNGTSVAAFGNETQFSSDGSFALAGLVEPGFPAQSWLIRSLPGGEIASMPKGGSISAADRIALQNWILKMGEL